MKQTITWIGGDNQRGDILMKLAEHYRLLWVKREGEHHADIFHDIPGSEVEILDCAKEGCWEADIIVFSGEILEEGLPEKIREVATQKIVLVITWDNKNERQEEKLVQVRKALPFSKTVGLIFHRKEMILSGENPEAVDTAKKIVQLLGY